MSSGFFLEKELGLRMIRQWDSIGGHRRRDWGCAFATNVKDSSWDAGVSSQTRSRRVPVGCSWSGTTVFTAAVLEVRPEDRLADFFSIASDGRPGNSPD